MKNELKTHHLSVYGRKIELIERLVKFRANLRECRVIINRLMPEEIPLSSKIMTVPNQIVTRSAKQRAILVQKAAIESGEIASVDTVSIKNQIATRSAKRRAISYQQPAQETREIAPVDTESITNQMVTRGAKRRAISYQQPAQFTFFFM